MKKNQLYGIILMFMLIAIDACAMMSTPQNVVDKDLIKLSILGVVNFVFEILIWHKISKEWFSPYIAFFIVANIFCVGQMFGWAFGIDMGELDLLHYIPKINVNTLYHALIYSILGIACFHTGAIFSYKSLYFDMKNRSTQKNDRDYQSIIRVAKVLFVISFPAALFQLYKSAITSLTMGYGETYVISSSLSKVQRLLLYPSEWFPICLLIMYVAYQKNFRIKKILEIIIIAYLSAIMITGGRSGAVMFVLAFCITRHYLIKPFNRKNVLSIFLGGYLGLALLNTVSITRTISNRTLGEVFSTFLNAIPNALGNILGELGWSMTSLAWTMDLIPYVEPFRMGSSYLYAFTAIIPNLGLWSVHPAAKYSNLGDWLQKSLGRNSGLGYTFVAEAYANFSWIGIVFLFVIGVIVGKLLNKVNKKNAQFNYKYTFLVVMIILCLLKSFVRSSFSAIMRDSVFVIGFFYLLVFLDENRRKV